MRWSPEQIERLTERYLAGASAAMIAEEFRRELPGVTGNAVVGLFHRHGIKPTNRGGPSALLWPAESDQELRNLWATTLTRREIAERLGITKASVIGRAARLKLGRRPQMVRAPAALKIRERREKREPRQPCIAAPKIATIPKPKRPLKERLPSPNAWLPEHVEKLSALWTSGVSAEIIAVELGRTEQAVRKKVWSRRLRRMRAEAPAPVTHKCRPDSPWKNVPSSGPRAPLEIIDEFVAASAGKTIIEVLFGERRFPIGVDEEGIARFCAAPTVGAESWCPTHRKICFLPPRARAWVDKRLKHGMAAE